jgi:membrane protein
MQPRQALAEVVPLAREAFAQYRRHRGQWLAAAIAYFTMFAIAPLVIVIVEIAGLFLGHHQAVLNALYGYLAQTAGPSASHGIASIVTASLSQRRAGLIAQIVGWAVFLLGAMGLFTSLQDALNIVWDVDPPKKSIVQTVAGRLFSFGMVLCMAFVLLVSLGLNSALTIAGSAMSQVLPLLPTLIKGVDFVVSLALITLVFSLLFEYLPDCRIAWRDVWLGAGVSALLFVIGQFALGWYLGRPGISSSYGSFGGIVVFMLWAYYSAQILLLGAEFTRVYAAKFGSLRTAVQTD